MLGGFTGLVVACQFLEGGCKRLRWRAVFPASDVKQFQRLKGPLLVAFEFECHGKYFC